MPNSHRSEQLRGLPIGDDMFGRMRLRQGLRASASGIFRVPRDQHPELGGDHVQPPGYILADLRHLAAPAGPEHAGRLDTGQMRAQIATITLPERKQATNSRRSAPRP